MPMSIDMPSMIVLVTLATSALMVGAVAGDKQNILRSPVSDSPFRSDTTLRFMRRIEVPHVEAEPLQQTFQQDQPGYSNSNKWSARSAEPEATQESKPNAMESAFRDLQQGPKYDDKKAQKAADRVAKKQEGSLAATPLERFGTGVSNAGDALADVLGGGTTKADKGSTEKGTKVAEKPMEKSEEAPVPSGLGEPEAEPEAGPEEKEVPSVPGCRNSPKGWADAKGNDCEDYAEGEWCNRHGGYGDAWLDEWGTFEDVATKGKSGAEVCCVCGGGFRSDEDSAGSSGMAPAGAPAGAPFAAAAASPAGAVRGSAKISKREPGSLQSQGYSGDWVLHEDGSTMTEDWGKEFGPHSGSRDVKTICAEHPGNEWCDLHGYYPKERSAASSTCMRAVFVAMFFACLR